MKRTTMLGMALCALAGAAAAGDLAVSAYWQDHMVLQRGKKITVWGKDAAGRRVTVSFANQAATATTDADGYWETTFAQPFDPSSSAQTLTISDDGNESLSISDVLVGDVFLAGGQSNMDRRLEDKAKSNFEEPQSIKDFCRDDDGIRFLRIARSAENATAGEQLFDLPPLKAVNDTVKYYGEGYDWSPATGTNRNYVSSVALNFARYVRDANAARGEDIPIGIVHASSGGTYIREWIAPSVLIDNGIDSPGSAASSDGWFWNNMMAPILRAKFRAVLWYQGCSDAQRSVADYKKLMDVLVKDRRDRWGDGGDLPFYAVQIATPGYSQSAGTVGLDQYPAPTEDNVGHNYVRVREAQRLWDASDAGAHGLVTTVDCVPCLGANDLHPVDKNFIGRRLSLFARRDIYGETDLQAEGPAFTRAVREADGSVRVFFKSGTAKGLTAGRVKPASSVAVSRWVKKGTDPIRGFALCDANGAWQEAEATVEGETVVLRAAGVPTPTQFHYGYWCITRSTELEDGQRLNLYNGDGLPMSPVAPQAVEDPDASTKVADPVLLPASCFFSPSTNVTIACATSGATVRYTLDGSEPTATSAAYAAPIALSATTTVGARAFAANKDPSDIVFATYTLGEPPAPEPDPQWTNGAYEPSAWAPIGENLLANATASYEGNLSYICTKDMAKLTDGKIPVDISGNTGAGSQTEVVGFQEDSAAVWTFAEPTTIGKIRISTRWATTSFDAITVKDVYVLQGDDWVALGVPDSHRTGVASITTGSLEATLEDEALGYLAQNVSGLKIVFGAPESTVANYYAEIEAIAPGGEIMPAEMAAAPTFSPAACSFYPTTNVTLSCTTAGATIRYTLDGSAPSATSTPYTVPIALTATTTVKARAYADGMTPSGIASATYTLADPATPPDDPTVTTNGMWQASSCAPANWTPLAGNLLAGRTGTISGATAGSTYASSNPGLLTDGSVPAEGGAMWIVGLQNNASISWTFEAPTTLDRVRASCGYLAQTGFSGFTVSAIEVQTFGSTEWTAVTATAGQMADNGQADILTLVLADGSGSPLAESVGALKVTFGAPPAGFANYCAEIEAVGTASGGESVATPAFDPASCNFHPTTNVTLSCATEGATIRYTLDGSDPTAESAVYGSPIELSATTTIKARAYAEGMNPSAVASATYTFAAPVEPGMAWTTGSSAPSAWTPLANNLIAGRSGTTVGNLSYLANHVASLTDGEVPDPAAAEGLCGFCNGTTIAWNFDAAKTLEAIRLSAQTYWSGKQYHRINVSKIEVKYASDGTWETIDAPALSFSSDAAEGNVPSATLANDETGSLATGVWGIRLSFATDGTYAYYCAEIEAVGTDAVIEPAAMFYIGETGYDSWTNAYQAAKAGDTITLGTDAVIDPPVIAGVLGKSLTIDLNGHELEIVECWLTGCTVAVVDSGAPAGSGRFTIVPTGMNISGGTLDLSALSDDQVTGYFQMSSTSLLKSPGDRSEAYTTTHLWFDAADPAHGVGARIVVRGLTYEWDGVSWGIAFRITSIDVDDEYVELGVLVAPEYGVSPYVTILGCTTVNGQFHARPDATTADGALYRLPVSDDRFFQAVLGMPD